MMKRILVFVLCLSLFLQTTNLSAIAVSQNNLEQFKVALSEIVTLYRHERISVEEIERIVKYRNAELVMSESKEFYLKRIDLHQDNEDLLHELDDINAMLYKQWHEEEPEEMSKDIIISRLTAAIPTVCPDYRQMREWTSLFENFLNIYFRNTIAALEIIEGNTDKILLFLNFIEKFLFIFEYKLSTKLIEYIKFIRIIFTKEPEAFVIDIDGTITEHSKIKISDSILESIIVLLKLGKTIVLCSGRTFKKRPFDDIKVIDMFHVFNSIQSMLEETSEEYLLTNLYFSSENGLDIRRATDINFDGETEESKIHYFVEPSQLFDVNSLVDIKLRESGCMATPLSQEVENILLECQNNYIIFNIGNFGKSRFAIVCADIAHFTRTPEEEEKKLEALRNLQTLLSQNKSRLGDSDGVAFFITHNKGKNLMFSII
jgi:hypothetical protein